MTGTRTYEAIDATFVLLVNDAQYRYMATSDGKPFSYFLNPAAYGGGVAKVRWDGTNWVFEGTESTTAPASLSYLDDRYTLGAGYGANNVINTSGNGTPVLQQGYLAPLGTALPASEIVFSSGTLKIPGMSNVSLTPTYESAVIRPVLILKVYESRLASYEYYTYIGEYESGSGSDTNTASALFQLYVDGDKAGLIDALLGQWVKRLKNNYATDTHLNYNLDNFYGDNYTAWKNALSANAVSGINTLTVPTLSYVDGWNVKGEKAEEVSSGHMAKPHVMLPGLTLVVGNEYFGLKNMRGVYTIFQRPEQLQYLAQVVKNTLTTLVGSVSDNTFKNIYSLSTDDKDAIVDTLTEKLNVHWYDYFRGSESTVHIPVAWDSAGDPTAFKDVTVNVFMGINTQGNNLAGTISYYTKDDTVDPPVYTRVETTGMGVNLGDVFSYYDGEQDKSQPFPTAYGYVTGPYGSQVLVDNDTGKKLGYKSDAYTV